MILCIVVSCGLKLVSMMWLYSGRVRYGISMVIVVSIVRLWLFMVSIELNSMFLRICMLILFVSISNRLVLSVRDIERNILIRVFGVRLVWLCR